MAANIGRSGPATARPTDSTALDKQPRRGAPEPELLNRHGGRTLDPGTAVRLRGQSLEPTVYAGSQLLLRPSANESGIIDHIRSAADDNDLDIAIDPVDQRLRRMARAAGISPEEAQPLISRIRLVPRWDGRPVPPPDAWAVLQSFRSRYKRTHPDCATVQLNHLMTAAVAVGGKPYIKAPGTDPNPYIKAPSWGDADTGYGERTPVTWVGPEPIRTPDDWLDGHRRPVVAILDTGVGTHHWLPDGIVDRSATCGNLRIGLTDAASNPEVTGVVSELLTGALDSDAGHGTFIAGLIRQKCPDANILGIRVIQGDGVVSEADLLEALNMLWLRQKLAIVRGEPDRLIDVISLSLGYYHEQPADAAFDPLLLAPLRALTELGVAIVASAGNDATTRPMFPAAFAPYEQGQVRKNDRNRLPIVAVGALNPDGTVALFSNAGPWVRVHRPGAALISTLPKTFDAARNPSSATTYDGRVRSTIDPDDFTSGFGIWHGTSFAAPILAGEIASWLHQNRRLDAEDCRPEEALERSWDALSTFIPRLRRPRK